jgi:hypothetical protein
MHFKHPEVLYFLFLLIIPILVHLFQLRRFKKEYFTNVRFLQELSVQTRKSSKIKKWLLLCTRLLILAAVIIAFAQPFFKAKDSRNATNELYVILDNSWSMQAKGKQGELLQRAIQDLLLHVPEGQVFSLLTNDDEYWNTDIKSITRDLQQLKFSATPFNLEAQLAKLKARKTAYDKDVVVITDAKGVPQKHLSGIPSEFNTVFVNPKAEQKANISIDSVYISGMPGNFYELSVKLSTVGRDIPDAPLSVYNHGKLIAKTLAAFEGDNKIMTFTIPKEAFDGYVSVEDAGLSYDNTYYFSIGDIEKLNVISIGATDRAEFLSRIYKAEEFNYSNYEISALPYNQLEKQDAIILNELDRIPSALQTTLKSFAEKGGNVIVIPSEKCPPSELNALMAHFGKLTFGDINTVDKMITRISFGHPVYQGVFEKTIENFQYPSVKKSFALNGNYPAILHFDDQSMFLTGIQKDLSTVYVFSSPINKDISNFQNSPLVVVTFFGMVQNSVQSGISAATIGMARPVVASVSLASDEIVKVRASEENGEQFIPAQQFSSGKVKLTFGDLPHKAGNYGIYRDQELIKNIGFNYNRSEGVQMETADLSDLNVSESTATAFDGLHADRSNNELWKWFAFACLLFLITELFIQKFVK